MVAAPSTAAPFIGRVEAVEALRRRFEEARAGHGGVTFLVGDVGVGKSTLAREIEHRAREAGVQVLAGRAQPLENPPPFLLLRQALENARTLSESVPLAPPEASPLAFVPAQSEGVLIGFAPRIEPSRSVEPVAVEERLLEALHRTEDQADADRTRLFSWLTEQFLSLTKQGPTLLILDDLHLADDSSLDGVEHLAVQLRHHPLWILATVRTLSALADPRRSRLERMQQTTHATSVAIRPLTPAELSEFIQHLEPERSVDREQIARWHSETGGNPLFLEQILKVERDVGPTPKATGTTAATSPELAKYLAQILARLDVEEHRVLAVASVLGQEFPFLILLRASGEEEERLAETANRLVLHGVLLEHPDERLAFVGDEIRERIYNTLTDTRRRLLHRRAAEAIESTGMVDAATVYALARHYYLAHNDEKAEAYNRMAADLALKSFAAATARTHLERALECHQRAQPKDIVGEIELTLALSLELAQLGELHEAEKLLRETLAQRSLRTDVAPEQEAVIRLYLTRILADLGEWKEAERVTSELAATVEKSTSPLTRISLHRLRGETLYYLGRYDEALREHDISLELARRNQLDREIALELVRRGNVLAMMPGRSPEAIASVREAGAALVVLGDKGEAAYAHLFLGVILAGEDRLDESIAELRLAARLGEEANDLRRVAWSLFNLADILRQSKQIDEARVHNQRSREILGRIGDRFGLVQAMIIQGKILLDLGQLDAAEVELLDAYRLVRELKAPADEVDVVLRLAELAYARGDRSSARRRIEELDRVGLPRLRPDIATDFEKLKRSMAEAEGIEHAKAA